jgi:N-acetylglutamate synthase-like GNAT family acetyltransferase
MIILLRNFQSWNEYFMAPKYKFRKIKKSDKGELIKIVSKIWDGNDFIPYCFDDWQKDKKGEFTAIEFNGKLIGCAKMTFLTDTDVWLQGLRTDIDLELKGVGQALTQYFIDKLSKQKGVTSIRFATHCRNLASVISNEKVGFRVAQRLTIKRLAVVPEDINKSLAKKVERITNPKIVLNFIRKSGYYKSAGNNINIGWIVYPYSENVLREKFIKPGMCFGVMKDDELTGLVMALPGKSMKVAFLDAVNKPTAKKLIEHVKLMALDNEGAMIAAYLPEYYPVRRWFDEFGFEGGEEQPEFLIYEYPLENFKKKK